MTIRSIRISCSQRSHRTLYSTSQLFRPVNSIRPIKRKNPRPTSSANPFPSPRKRLLPSSKITTKKIPRPSHPLPIPFTRPPRTNPPNSLVTTKVVWLATKSRRRGRKSNLQRLMSRPLLHSTSRLLLRSNSQAIMPKLRRKLLVAIHRGRTQFILTTNFLSLTLVRASILRQVNWKRAQNKICFRTKPLKTNKETCSFRIPSHSSNSIALRPLKWINSRISIPPKLLRILSRVQQFSKIPVHFRQTHTLVMIRLLRICSEILKATPKPLWTSSKIPKTPIKLLWICSVILRAWARALRIYSEILKVPVKLLKICSEIPRA